MTSPGTTRSTQRVLVTGATGFVGRHLCPALEHAGYIVRRALRTAPPPGTAGEHVVVGEIDGSTDWSAALRDVDYVVHLAGIAHRVGVPDAELEPLFQRVNHEGTKRLAEAVAQSPSVRRLVFLSSVKAVAPFRDDEITPATACAPGCAYGRSKRMAEEAIAAALAGGGADYCILRPCLIYGPGNLANMARLLRLAETGLPLPFGAIRNRKTFVYVGNLCDLIVRALAHPGASRATLLVGDGETVSTPELVRRIGEHARRRPRLVPMPVWMLRGIAHVGDAVHRLTGRSIGWDSYAVDRLCGSLAVDASETFSRLDWKPPYTMQEGLRLTVAAGHDSSRNGG